MYVNFTVHPNLRFNLHIQVNDHNLVSKKRNPSCLFKLEIEYKNFSEAIKTHLQTSSWQNIKLHNVHIFEIISLSNPNSNFKITMKTHNSNKFEKSAEPKLLFQICNLDIQIQENYQNPQFNF
jgi:hypothetical protein